MRIPEIRKALEELIISTASVGEIPDQGDSYSELLKIIKTAFSKSEEAVSMDQFRLALGLDYPHTFQKNQAGDAHTFCSWLHQVFTQNEECQGELSEIVKETFEIEYLRFIFSNDISHDDEGNFYNLLHFLNYSNYGFT